MKWNAQKSEAQRENGIASSRLTETQNKWSVANDLVVVSMENVCCRNKIESKFISFFYNCHWFFAMNYILIFAILYLGLQNLIFSLNTLFLFCDLYFCLQFFFFLLNTYFFLCNTLFCFCKTLFFCIYIYICGIKLTPYTGTPRWCWRFDGIFSGGDVFWSVLVSLREGAAVERQP